MTAENGGVIDPVESAWHRLSQSAGDPGPFSALVRAAYAQPLSRQLYPVMSMWELHFSRCTERPGAWARPWPWYGPAFVGTPRELAAFEGRAGRVLSDGG